MDYDDFGENLKRLRKGQGLTQRELGAKVGLSKAAVSKYESGISFPSFDILLQLARHFGVTTDYLLGVARGKTVDVSGLTDTQIDAIHRLISEFHKSNDQL